MLRLVQLAPDAVDVHDALRRVVMSEDLGVELAEPLRLLLGQGVLHNKLVDLGEQAVVSLLVLLRLGEIGTQPVQPSAIGEQQLKERTYCSTSERKNCSACFTWWSDLANR